MVEAFEPPRDPLALRARLKGECALVGVHEHDSEWLSACADAPFIDSAVVVPNSQLTLAFAQIESYRINGGWPPGLCLVLGR